MPFYNVNTGGTSPMPFLVAGPPGRSSSTRFPVATQKSLPIVGRQEGGEARKGSRLPPHREQRWFIWAIPWRTTLPLSKKCSNV